MLTKPQIAAVCTELQALQRMRAIAIKSRNMQANRLQALVAGTIGYSPTLAEKDREKVFKEATGIIKKVIKEDFDTPLKRIIQSTMVGIDAFQKEIDGLEKEMKKQAENLPVADWVDKQEQRGFGILFLGIVIGETGDLYNYANPAKVWRRLGCAPWTYADKTQMGQTWRRWSDVKLPADEWQAFGYSPRRRSIAYLIGEGIVKQNQSGPYRRRYDDAKAKIHELHADYKPIRCHLHGMLLATKLLLKNLWIEWWGDEARQVL